MLTNKETFEILQSLYDTIDIKSNIISKEKRMDKDDVKSIIYMTTFNYVKKYYNSKKSKPITFFLNFAFPKSRVEITRQMLPIKLSHGLVEKGVHHNLRFTSLDVNAGEEDDQDLYNLFGSYNDNTIDFYDSETYTNKLLRNSNLTAKEEDILKMYYGLHSGKQYSLAKIGQKYNVSYEYIRAIREKGLSKIRKYNNIGVN